MAFIFPPIINPTKRTGKVYTATYIKVGVQYVPMQSPIPSSLETVHNNGISIAPSPGKSIKILNLYIPQSPHRPDTEWLTSLEALQEDWLVVGDFNARHPLWDNLCEPGGAGQKSFVADHIINTDLCLLNTGVHTRIPDRADHQPTAIDLSLISPALLPIADWEVGDDSLGSDHLPITITVQINVRPQCSAQEASYNYKHANWSCFQSNLTASVHDLKSPDVDEYCLNVTSHIIAAADKSIPKSRKTGQQNVHPSNPWWNEECEVAKKEKRKSYKIWKKYRTEEYYTKMKKAKTMSNRVIAQAKRAFFVNTMTSEVQSHADLSKAWKSIKVLRNEFNLPASPVEVDGCLISEDADKAEVFAQTFASVSLSSSLPQSVQEYRVQEEAKPEYSDPLPDDSMAVNHILTLKELKEAIASVSSVNVSSGPDKISYHMIRHFPDSFLCVILDLFQTCWENGRLPKAWKHSIVVPVPKPGKPRKQIGSYRPISLTSHLSKIYERIVKSRLEYFVESRGVLPNCQAGFRKARSVTDHLASLTSHIKTVLKKKKCITATFFDVRRVFDTVCLASEALAQAKAGETVR